MSNPIYLGDGVYASFDGYQIKLMANSHSEPTDVVYLELGILDSLNKWINALLKAQEELS